MNFVLFFLVTALIWATKRSHPDTENEPKKSIPQINPNGIVLDYKTLPKIESVIEGLRPKAKDELSPEKTVQL